MIERARGFDLRAARSARRAGLLLLTLLWSLQASSEAEDPAPSEEEDHLALPEIFDSRPFLRIERPPYRNYAFDLYEHRKDHTFPWDLDENVGFQNRPQAFYSGMGDFMITGYDLFDWRETRRPGQVSGSSLFKDWTSWHYVFDQVVVGRDSYKEWGYSIIVGDGLISRFTPLTLSMTDFNGVRLDLSAPHLKFTALGSRIARPNVEHDWRGNPNAFEENTDNSTMLVGSRTQAEIGALSIGFNGVNLHPFRSTGTDNSLRGILRPDHPLTELLLVRFSDDSPGDGSGGALVQEVRLLIDGRPRPDITPAVIRHPARTGTQVGRHLSTGFQPTFDYNEFIRAPSYYRDLEIPLYADLLYRLSHEDSDFLFRLQNEDTRWRDKNPDFIEKNTHLEGLLSTFVLESPEDILSADGEEVLVFIYDLSAEPDIESVQIEAVVGNDYRVEMASIYEEVEAPGNLDSKYRSTPYQTVLRARGNVRDQSNVETVRFDVGANTGIFTYSADVHLGLPGFEITGEYARSARFARFPARAGGTPAFDRSPRFTDQGSACFVNGTSWFGRGRAGFELFSMNPDFTTEMVAYLPRDSSQGYTRRIDPFFGLSEDTMVWRLVQDNEDGDRWPEVLLGAVVGAPAGGDRGQTCWSFDCDGTFPGQDADNDGISDVNRNLNPLPDYEEPFLMYEVDPNDFVYGLDRNNNDEPDIREDDYEPDYPYDPDQRGYHLFAQYDMTPRLSFGMGRHHVVSIAGGGRNHSSYALLTYRREGLERLRRIFFENHFRRVEDDIPDEFNRTREDIELIVRGAYSPTFDGLPAVIAGNPIVIRTDPLLYADSYVNETYLEGHWRPRPGFNAVQKLRLRLNWQQERLLPGGAFQRQRRLDQWNAVSRADYTRYWGKLKIQPQFKFMLLQLRDVRQDQWLRSELSLIPILRLEYPLLSRTTLQLGIQGIGPFPYRFEDRAAMRNTFERRTKYLNLTNRSMYFGYELFTIIGYRRDKQEFDDPLQQFREFDSWTFFIRGLIGFTQYGRPM